VTTPTRRTGSGPADIGSADRLIVEGNRAEDEGRVEDARRLYEEAVGAAPGYARAHLNLGVALEALQNADGARRCFESALACDPANPFASYNLGKLLYSRGSLHEAEGHLRAALEHKAEFADAHVVLAAVLEALGDDAGAAGHLEQALAQRPDYPVALLNFAIVARRLGRRSDAEGALRKVLALGHAEPRALIELGTLLHELGRADEAEPLLRTAAEEAPDWPEAHLALARVDASRGRHDAALSGADRAIALRAQWGQAWLERGIALVALQRFAGAEAALRRAVELGPELTEGYRRLASILVNQLRIDDGLKVYEAGRRHDPGGYLRASELFALTYSDALSTEALFERHKEFGEAMERAHAPIVARFGNSRDPERRLRVGYVSGDLSFHAVALFLIPLLERHDKSVVETWCYSMGDVSDEITARIVALADHWLNAAQLPRAEVAETIAHDRIDILVDLSGHSGVPAFDVFVRRPAPVQASWLGYLCTTGLTRIDYRITDAVADPPGASDRYHTETLVRLPRVQWCYRPMVDVAVSAAPACARNGYVTFVSCNHTAKLSRTVRRIWAQILLQAPGTRLLALGVAQGPARETVLRDFAEEGIDPSRIAFEPRLPLEAYFRRLDGADIALDAMPYSGGTTTCDALWMGVPVVTAPGTRSVSRSAASILTTVGLRDWIASTPEDYVRRAVAAAADPEALRGFRATLRSRMRASALTDEPQFARDMEDAYRRMWRTWCAGAAQG
jgi:predicted O-linked N-acetylglucosamine transferase (SPINDLY family)